MVFFPTKPSVTQTSYQQDKLHLRETHTWEWLVDGDDLTFRVKGHGRSMHVGPRRSEDGFYPDDMGPG